MRQPHVDLLGAFAISHETLRAVAILGMILAGSVDRPRAQTGLANSPWPMHQHDARHTGRSSYVGPITPSLTWRTPLPGQPGGIAIAADGTLYVPTGRWPETSGHLVAIAPDGTIRWTFALSSPAGIVCGRTTPAVAADGTVYLYAAKRALFALHPTGTLRWRYDTGVSINNDDATSPAIDPQGTVYVTGNDLTLHAINPDGTLKWRRGGNRGNSRLGSPAITDTGIILSSDMINLDAWRADGSLAWSAPYSDSTAGNHTVSVADSGRLHITGSWFGYQPHVITLAPDGSAVWRAPIGSGSFGGTLAVSANGTVHATDGAVRVFDANGTALWIGTGGTLSRPYCDPVVDAAGRVFVHSAWNLDAHSALGHLLFSHDLGTANRPGTAPGMAIGADGTLYVPAGDSFGGQHSLRAFRDPPHPAAFTPFGTGCRGNAGIPTLRSSPTSLPWIGEVFVARLTNVDPTQSYGSLGFIGTSRTTWGSVPLPLDLGPLAMPGCSLYTNPLVTMAVWTPVGAGDWRIALPGTRSLVGAALYTQCLAMSPGTNAVGLVMSNPCELRIGAH